LGVWRKREGETLRAKKDRGRARAIFPTRELETTKGAFDKLKK